MISPIFYNTVTPFTYAAAFCQPVVSVVSPAMAWIAFGKIGENPVVTPNAKTQVIRASGVNRFLQTVTVKPIPTTPPTP